MRIYIAFAIVLTTLFACKNEQIPPAYTDSALNNEIDNAEVVEDSPYAAYSFDMLMGKFEPAEHPDYLLIDKQYADREGMYLHKDTYAAFQRMYDHAMKDEIQLVIRSATRNFESQKRIWENKWNGTTKVGGEDISKTITDPEIRALKILEYSSMPGTSRHHWGTDIDLNSFDNEWFETGEGRKLWDWLEENGPVYGFCRPYTEKNEDRPEGYFEERWHWSYIPLAKYFTDMAKKEHNDSKIDGFLGSEVADGIDVVEKYVFGINKDCL